MAAYKNPSFQERVASAARAKNSALEQLRAKPPLDEAEVAARAAKALAREAKQAEQRQAKQGALNAKRESTKQAALAKANAEAAAEAASAVPILTEAEQKAIRDARYAMRKKRKS